jgi:hypothetical protein
MGSLFLAWIPTFWIIIHFLHRKHLFRPKSPLSSHSYSRRSAQNHITLQGVHLRLESTALNITHDAFSAYIHRHPKLKIALDFWYGIGVLLGVCGMLAGVCGLGFINYMLLQTFLPQSDTPTTLPALKRAPIDASLDTSSGNLEPYLLVRV